MQKHILRKHVEQEKETFVSKNHNVFSRLFGRIARLDFTVLRLQYAELNSHFTDMCRVFIGIRC